MDKIDAKKLAEALNVTEQQLELMTSIYKLHASGKRSNPKAIREEYRATYGRGIQNPNFFSQTKKLQDAGLVRRTGAAVYEVDLEAIRKTLSGRKEQRLKELKELDRITEETSEYFRQIAYAKTRPIVEYLKYEDIVKAATKRINSSSRVYMTTNFPLISYTYPVANAIGRGEMVKALWDNCFEKEKLEAYFLTTLDIDFPFNHAFTAYRDPKAAYKECKIIIEQLKNQLEKQEKLHIKYIKDLHGADLFIPEKKEADELFIYTRDEHRNIQGGIHIQSPDTAYASKNSFMHDYQYAQDLSGDRGEKIIRNLEKDLEEKYGAIKQLSP